MGRPKVHFYSGHHHGKDKMIEAAHGLLDQADAVVHYNGKRFDIPHLNREFLLAGLTPPSPYQQIDLLSAVKRNFKFPSNKLAYVSEVLGLGGKVKHQGHELWIKCMAGDRGAWATMKAYNIQDTILLEEVYEALFPWLSLPTRSLFSGDAHCCPSCGSAKLTRRGLYRTKVSAYQRYRCDDCGTYSRGKKAVESIDLRAVAP